MKTLILSFLLTILTFSAFAQEDDNRIRLAFTLSPQLSWIKSDAQDVESGGGLFGYNFGVVLHKFFAPNYAFNSGLTINTTGGVLKYPATNPTPAEPTVTQTYRLKYIEVPFGLHLRTNDIRRVVYYGQFGLSNQFNIKAVDKDGKSINSAVNFYDLGYHIGGGVEYSLGGTNYLMMGLQLNNGITDISNDDTYKDKAVLNRLVFQFALIF